MVGVFGIAKDTTALKKVEEALRASEERYRLIAQNMSDLVSVWDVNGRVRYASPSHEQVLGIKTSELEGNIAFDFIYQEDVPHARSKFMDMLNFRKNDVIEFRYEHVNGSLIWIEAKGTLIADDNGHPLHILIVARDITERRLFEEKLNYMAYYDSLTGIANRRLFQEKLEQSLKEAKRYQRKLAIMYMDLDKFKYINDTFGHDVGDELLKQFAKRVQSCLRESDTFARLGGDEFTIILNEIHDEQAALQIGERILSKTQEPLHIGEHVIQTSSSIGISIYPTDGSTAGELMKNADNALYEVKASGRNRVKLC